MCNIVSLGGKNNILEPRNCISASMSSALDLLTANSIGNIFLPWVIHMCNMVTLGGKGNIVNLVNRTSTSMFSALEL
jgi:hypothetical protein